MSFKSTALKTPTEAEKRAKRTQIVLQESNANFQLYLERNRKFKEMSNRLDDLKRDLQKSLKRQSLERRKSHQRNQRSSLLFDSSLSSSDSFHPRPSKQMLVST